MLAGRERRVKVLDFGLAKLREEAAADGETTTAALSGEGRILGTVAYMSPEQAEGKPVDARSDLFSLGIVLYELATSERPFKGDTSISVLSAILRDTPKSVTELRADLPKEFARIIRQCLQKDPEERIQTAKDVRNQLRTLKADLDSGEIPARDANASAAPRTAAGGRSRSVRTWAIAAGVVALAALGGAFVWRYAATRPTPTPFASFRVKRLTDTGNVQLATVSPDGRYLAYVLRDGMRMSLWVRQIETGSDVNIVGWADNVRFSDALRFSPNGTFVYYAARSVDANPQVLSVFRIPTLGGAPRRLFEGPVGDSPDTVSPSPDGTRLAFVRERDNGAFSDVVVSSIDGTEERRIATRKISGPTSYRFADIDWAPDGRTLRTLVFSLTIGTSTAPRTKAFHIRVVLVDLDHGSERDAGEVPVDAQAQCTWLPDGSGFLMVGKKTMEDQWTQVWLVTYPGLEAREITRDTSSYGGFWLRPPSVTADGRSLVSVQSTTQANIWVLSPPDDSVGRQVTRSVSGEEGGMGLDWTPDGRLVFTSLASGNWDIWSMNGDGSDRRQLTRDQGRARSPSVSPDGRVIAFSVLIGRGTGVWVMDPDGGRQRRLTPWGPDDLPRGLRFFTADSRSVVVGRGTREEWKVALDDNQSGRFVAPTSHAENSRVVPPGFFPSSISPDGVWTAGFLGKVITDGWAVVRMDGSAPWREMTAFRGKALRNVRWTPDSRSLTYSDGWNLWAQPLDGGPARQLTAFTGVETISSFAWSRDGRQLAVSRGQTTSDVVMITSEEKK